MNKLGNFIAQFSAPHDLLVVPPPPNLPPQRSQLNGKIAVYKQESRNHLGSCLQKSRVRDIGS